LFVYTRTWLVFCLAELGEFAEGIGRAKEALPTAEALNEPWILAHASWSIAAPYLVKGDPRSAIPVLERSLTLCRTRDVPIGALAGARHLGSAYILAGRLADGLPLLEEAATQTFVVNLARHLARLGDGYLRAGRTGAALDVARRALDLARECQERGSEAWVLHLVGDIALSEEPPAIGRAQTSYRQTLALAEERGMRPLVAHCHLGLGKLYRRTGEHVQAQEHLTTATTMYREMGMTYWLEQAEAELRALA
jgi:tetratricopeptide (TPR) repeat protein